MPVGRNKKTAAYYVYMVMCRLGTLYTGYTNDIEKRLADHNSGKGAKYLRGKGPVVLVYVKKFRMLSAALKEEIRIKKLSRKGKESLIT